MGSLNFYLERRPHVPYEVSMGGARTPNVDSTYNVVFRAPPIETS